MHKPRKPPPWHNNRHKKNVCRMSARHTADKCLYGVCSLYSLICRKIANNMPNYGKKMHSFLRQMYCPFRIDVYKYTKKGTFPVYLCNVVHVFLHEKFSPRNEFSVRNSLEKLRSRRQENASTTPSRHDYVVNIL